MMSTMPLIILMMSMMILTMHMMMSMMISKLIRRVLPSAQLLPDELFFAPSDQGRSSYAGC